MWYQIINVLKGSSFKDIHEINRAAIIDDLLNLARAGYISYNIALDGLQYIVKEDNYIPLKSAFVGLDYLEKRFAGQPNYELFAVSFINKFLIFNFISYRFPLFTESCSQFNFTNRCDIGF